MGYERTKTKRGRQAGRQTDRQTGRPGLQCSNCSWKAGSTSRVDLTERDGQQASAGGFGCGRYDVGVRLLLLKIKEGKGSTEQGQGSTGRLEEAAATSTSSQTTSVQRERERECCCSRLGDAALVYEHAGAVGQTDAVRAVEEITTAPIVIYCKVGTALL